MSVLKSIGTALVVVLLTYCLVRITLSERRITKLEEEVFRVRDRFRVFANQVRDVVGSIMDHIRNK